MSTPKIAFLLLSHHKPDQVEALAARICELSANARVYVHHDSRSAEAPWHGRQPPPRCYLITDRLPVRWGRWSIVQATLLLFDAARGDREPDWYAVISGEDWPIQDLDTWVAQLTADGWDVMSRGHPIADRPRDRLTEVPVADDEFRRYNDAWLIVSNPASKILRKLLRVSVRLAMLALARCSPRRLSLFLFYDRGAAFGWHRTRRLPAGWVLYKGPQWLAFNARAAAVLDQHRSVAEKHFRRTLIPDESFFQTIFCNAGLRVCDRALTWAPWYLYHLRPGLYLHEEDLAVAAAAGAVFVRKVDPVDRRKVLEIAAERVSASRSAAQPSGSVSGAECR